MTLAHLNDPDFSCHSSTGGKSFHAITVTRTPSNFVPVVRYMHVFHARLSTFFLQYVAARFAAFVKHGNKVLVP